MDEMISDAETLADERQDRPGLLLRRAREEKGMSLGDVAELTRVAQRQLEAIERSDFSALPGTPYAVGFARAYARAVGADESEIARGVREELGTMDAGQHYEAFEPVDPARIPPRRLAWSAAIIAVILALGYGVWRTQFFAASTDQEISDLSNRAGAQQAEPAQPAETPQIVATMGAVVLTAADSVWVRIYEQGGTRLLEKELAKGESFTVPQTAVDPLIMTGRPDALVVTVGGKPVAPLGPPAKTIVDMPISAAALLARSTGAGAPEASASTGQPGAPVSAAVAIDSRTPTQGPTTERQAASSPAPVVKPASTTSSAVSNSARAMVQPLPSTQREGSAASMESAEPAPTGTDSDN
jgi:cytoskeletal protein RodZ